MKQIPGSSDEKGLNIGIYNGLAKIPKTLKFFNIYIYIYIEREREREREIRIKNDLSDFFYLKKKVI